MRSALKKKWVKALRSGRYRQGSDRLKRQGNSYCCLGVLCTIQGAEWRWDKGDETFVPFLANIRLSELNGGEYLSPRALRLFGFGDKRQRLLASFNDGNSMEDIERKNFKEIADYIDKYM